MVLVELIGKNGDSYRRLCENETHPIAIVMTDRMTAGKKLKKERKDRCQSGKSCMEDGSSTGSGIGVINALHRRRLDRCRRFLLNAASWHHLLLVEGGSPSTLQSCPQKATQIWTEKIVKAVSIEQNQETCSLNLRVR
jgi:hypothetical protein